MEISAPPEMSAWAHFNAQHGLVFLPASWLILSSLAALLSGATVYSENTYSCSLKVTGQI